MKSYRYKVIQKWIVSFLTSLMVVFGAVLQAQAEGQVTITGFDITRKNDVTRFVTVVTGEAAFSATVLQNPYRVVIDLTDVTFELPRGAGRKSKGLVKQVRYGILEKGKSRIVVDTDGPVLIKQSQMLPAKGNAKPRIAIDLIVTTKEALAEVQANEAQMAGGETTASLAGVPPAVSVDDADQPVVVIDPGHGGIDGGAVSRGGTKEKDVVLAFALELKKALETGGQFKVLLTRDSDRFMSLTSRVAMARRVQADLLIALHADTVRGQTATGTTLYTLSETASDEEAQALAEKENRTDAIAGVNLAAQGAQVADVLIDLAQRESKNQANLFAQRTLMALRNVTLMTGKPLRSAGFVVLKSPDVPSMLVELGFLSSKDDEVRLLDPAWRTKVAGTFAESVRAHFAALNAAE